ncbi:putative Phytanoyl-CoA dioxygenase (PhyH)/2OG-Fe(II) oxygenase superfamily [Leishmania utingensis]|uniref:Phytanoyl-CoA dioxygenase (PhyH)/2OG-Fe(II) oxygenase superfamily n=1 Tax=Leishmania utingensis TaxID=653362 RepID=A0AAW3ARU3_9TRYP
MFRYNNIVEKGEPHNKEIIDHVLDHVTEFPTPRVVPMGDGKVDCIVLENVLTHEECDQLIEACETVGYTFWLQKNHHNANGEAACDSASKAVRVVDTIEANFPNLSAKLYERISRVVSLESKCFSENMPNAEELFERDLAGTWVPHALSENLLFGRYRPGGHFMPHADGSTIVDLNTRSLYTLLIYLNDCSHGGETFVFSGEQCSVMYLDEEENRYRGNTARRVGAVHPKKGSAALFYCNLLHEGAPVVQGYKYICRADLLYRRTPSILTSEADVKAFNLYQEARLAESHGDAERACQLYQRVRRLSNGVAALFQID